MDLILNFFGAFCSAATYRRLRYASQGIGLKYAFFLLLFVASLTTFTLYHTQPRLVETLLPKLEKAGTPEAVLLIFAVTIVLRAIMLFSLAIWGRLLALKLKPQMDYKAALRLAGVAYTPAAVVDAVMLCTFGITINPFLAFGCGAAMLLAAIYATSSSPESA